MTDWVILFAAGLLAGGMNAVTGGGTFVALPALAAAGLPATLANATSAVALLPGAVASAWAYRRHMTPLEGVSTPLLGLASLGGGLLGAILLLTTPAHAFDLIVPWLLLLATLVLLAGARLGDALHRIGLHVGSRGLLVIQVALGVYGGYFGGAVGLMMIAAWTLHVDETVARLTPLRTLMLTCANTAAVALFCLRGEVAWPQGLMVMAGAVAGGFLGAVLGRRLPPPLVRWALLAVAIATTAIFFVRAFA